MSGKAVIAQAPESIQFDAGRHARAKIGYVLLATEQTVQDDVIKLQPPHADAIFVSCGALRTLDVVAEIETCAAKPVVCSNQVMTWDCLRLAGIDDRFEGYGRLLDEF